MSPGLFPTELTPTERAQRRRSWRSRQAEMFTLAAVVAVTACPVCSGEHTADRCPHGAALALFD